MRQLIENVPDLSCQAFLDNLKAGWSRIPAFFAPNPRVFAFNPRISSRFFEKFRDCHLLTPAECIFMAENYLPEVAPCGT